MFDRGTARYERGVAGILRRRGRYMLIFLLIVGGLAVLFTRLPTSFLPEEDQGSVFVQVQLPVNASAERTRAVLDEVSEHILQEEGDIVDTRSEERSGGKEGGSTCKSRWDAGHKN